MFRFRLVACVLAVLLLAPFAGAWNFVTHRVIAAIAYDQLKPAARTRVDALIKRHPDYSRFAKDAPGDEAGRARAAFIEAAVWADQIRNDSRFYDETQRDPTPTPSLPGFPNMERHSGWHFIDLPFSQDGTPLEPATAPNIVTGLERVMAELTRPGSTQPEQAYDLVWLMHLAGDIHAPLHCVSRFSAGQPKGDMGGNLVFVTTRNSTGNSREGITLHKYWDDAVGTDTSPGWVASTVRELESSHPAGADSSRSPQFSPSAWAQESLNIANKEIYSFGAENGSLEHPLTLAQGYGAHAKTVAEAQVATAATRLAAFLNLQLK
jgi:hypothetical protein